MSRDDRDHRVRRADEAREGGAVGPYHEPVLVAEVLSLLGARGGGLYLDGTLGGGGHAARLLASCPECRLLGVDRDPEALAVAAEALARYGDRVRLLHCRFDEVDRDPEVRDCSLEGAILDLGVSSHQIDEGRRGFAFRRGVALDMRMDREGEGTAATLLATAPEEQLSRIFRELGEEPRARRLAREVVKRRGREPLRTSDDLVAALAVTLGRAPSAREKARVFQAVRMAVNEELEALERGLPLLRDALKDRGVLIVIAYHSLEDRMVKHAFREWSRSCICPPELPVCVCRGRPLGQTLTPHPVRPGAAEVAANPRARSARLRAWRRAA